jgi:hypothetical protein
MRKAQCQAATPHWHLAQTATSKLIITSSDVPHLSQPSHDAVTPQDSSDCCPEGPNYDSPSTTPLCSRRARPRPRSRPWTRQRVYGGTSIAYAIAETWCRSVGENLLRHKEPGLTQLAYSEASGSRWQRFPQHGRFTSFRATIATIRNLSSPA